ncbi:MAG TPA: type IV toxin-antitoxin system AbiEi family antitoxin [Candidatus Acidoferrum sp.]|jgi:DNA-binding MarR family transcriptional regulator|nr:type IV toxin-antitoxin system AbiEi family antitoxin [Candidatus Acidoferrum sp.]
MEQQVLRDLPRRLAELAAVAPSRVRVQAEHLHRPGNGNIPDLLIQVGPHQLAVEYKADGSAAPVAAAARQAEKYAERSGRHVIPLVVVPFMGEVGKRLCAEHGVSWLDLSGNARLEAPGLHVHVEGKPNRFVRPGRPANLFAPKSSRVARHLLIHRARAFSQRELAEATKLGEGFISRIVRGLEQQELVVREKSGAVRVANSDALLEAWREAYDFSKHHIVRGHVAARSSDQLLRQLAAQFKQNKIQYAATGLAGAWLLIQFAGFRLAVFYIAQLLSSDMQREFGFHEEERGENVWLVVPNDEGVFDGAAEHHGIQCVHPVQVYLDLKDHPERSADAAQQLREKLLKRSHGR